MIHTISHIENRLDSDGELRVECHGDVELYITAKQFAEIAEVFATPTPAIETPGIESGGK